MLLAAAAVAATPGVSLREGETIAQACLDDPLCAGVWGPQLSETMIEAGYALAHDPVLTSAFGGRGPGAVFEVQLDSVPLGPPNLLQSLYPLVPAVPRLAAGAQLGSRDLAGAGPQVALGLHGMPVLQLGRSSTWALGTGASAAVPVHDWVWLGAETLWTVAGIRVPLVPDVATIDTIEALDPYFKKKDAPECAEPCLDRMTQHAFALRAGVGFEPHPAAFAWLRGGLLVVGQRLVVAIDGSRWGWTAVMPEVSTGAGTRVGDRWHLSLGAAWALKPDAGTTAVRGMTKVVFSTGFRFGPVRS